MSVVGASIMVLSQELNRLTGSPTIGSRYIGCLVFGIAALGISTSNILVVSNLLDAKHMIS